VRGDAQKNDGRDRIAGCKEKRKTAQFKKRKRVRE